MKTTLDLTDSQKEELLEYYATRLADLRGKIEDVESIVAQLKGDNSKSPLKNEAISNQPEQAVDTSPHDYHKSWSWALKARYAINRRGHCITARQILDDLAKIDDTVVRKSMSSISAALSTKVSNNEMFNRYVPVEDSDFYYGLKEWFDSEGNVIDKYDPFDIIH